MVRKCKKGIVMPRNFVTVKVRVLRSFSVIAAACVLLAPTPVGANVNDNLNTSIRRVIERVDSLLSSNNTTVNKSGDAKQQINYLVGNTDEIKKNVIDGNADITNKISDIQSVVNASLAGQISELKDLVNQNFTNASNGKTNLYNTITGGVSLDGTTLVKGTVSNTTGTPLPSFNDLVKGIQSLGQNAYEKGRSEGIKAADSCVNKESASYLQGVEDSQLKRYTTDIHLVYSGPQSEEDCFTFRSGGENIAFWDYKKTLPGHTIVYAKVTGFTEAYYSQTSCVQTAVLVDDEYTVVKEGDNYEKILVKKDTIEFNGFRFVKMIEDIGYVDLKVNIYYI